MELKYMTESEYKMAIARIVSSGYGYRALDDLIHNMKTRDELAMKFMADADSTITAIRKTCNSSQNPQQKVKAVKALSESCVQDARRKGKIMSIYDDYIADAQYDRDFPFSYPDTIDPVWVTADGTKILVSEMDDDRIKNCMRLVGEDDEWYAVFKEELDLRMEQWFD